MSFTAQESYRSDRGNLYTFGYQRIASTWRIYILGQPSYGGRATDSVSTHRHDTATRPYICWTKAIGTLTDAKAVAHLWANGTDTYIATGSFPGPKGWFARLVDWFD